MVPAPSAGLDLDGSQESPQTRLAAAAVAVIVTVLRGCKQAGMGEPRPARACLFTVPHPRTSKERPMPALPEARVGDPVQHESLAVFPLFSEPQGGVEYLLADEALAAGAVTVEEVSEGGSVPHLL